MCRLVTCKKCGKPTWAGCGAHVEQVLGHIPKSQRCQGHTAERSGGDGDGKGDGFFARLFGKK